MQAPFVQAWQSPHAAPQAPQFSWSDLRFVSHPSVALSWLQSAHEAAHGPLHTPDVHLTCEMWFALHTRPHMPQFCRSAAVFVSQASDLMSLLQSVNPVRQVPAHAPFMQDTETTWFELQVASHAPQLFTFVAALVSQPRFSSQSSHGTLHTYLHEPPTHVVVVFTKSRHADSHAPQFTMLVPMFVSQPLVSFPSQFPKSATHWAISHLPNSHLASARGNEHVLPQ